MDRDAPWWWLTEPERRALGLGLAARRSADGVVFGDEGAPLRLEVLARRDDAPVKLGSAALRVWGDARAPRALALLRDAARLLHARRGRGFDPDAAPLDRAPAPSPARPTVVDLPSVCEQACAFCHVSRRPPGERRPHGDDATARRALAAATGPVLFTGDDALSHPDLVALVTEAAARTRDVAVIGPPRDGRTAALAPSLAAAGLARWITGLFGPDAATHDAVAGRAGSFDALVEASAAMRARGVSVELVTPLVRPVLPRLAATVDRAAALSPAPLALLAYAPDPVVGDAFDALVPDYDAVREALATVATRRLGVEPLPLCVLPEPLRDDARGVLERTDPGVGVAYPDATCAGCALRPRCPGVPGTVHRAVGARGLRRQ